VGVNRKGRHKERNRKKEEPEKAVELQQPDMDQASSDVVEDAQPADEENIYISDQEEEKRWFYIFLGLFSVISKLCRW